MNKIWNITQTICHRYSISKITTFLVLNTLFWGIIFLIAGLITLKLDIFPKTGTVELLLLIVGYGVIIMGMFGGIIFLLRRDIRDDRCRSQDF